MSGTVTARPNAIFLDIYGHRTTTTKSHPRSLEAGHFQRAVSRRHKRTWTSSPTFVLGDFAAVRGGSGVAGDKAMSSAEFRDRFNALKPPGTSAGRKELGPLNDVLRLVDVEQALSRAVAGGAWLPAFQRIWTCSLTGFRSPAATPALCSARQLSKARTKTKRKTLSMRSRVAGIRLGVIFSAAGVGTPKSRYSN